MKFSDGQQSNFTSEVSHYDCPSEVESFHKEPPTSIYFADFILTFCSFWWITAGIFLFTLCSALFYVKAQDEVFTATTTLELLRDDPEVMTNTVDLVPNSIKNAEDLNTELQIFESDQLRVRVVDALSYDELIRLVDPETLNENLSVSESSFITMELKEKALRVLAKGCEVAPKRLSLIVLIKFTHRQGDLAAKVADLYASEYINLRLNQNRQGSISAVKDLYARVDVLENEIQVLDNQLANYREAHQMVSIERNEDILISQLAQLNAAKLTAKSDLEQSEIYVQALEELQKQGISLTSFPMIGAVSAVQTGEETLNLLEVERSALATRYRAKHPTMVAIDQRIAETRLQLKQTIKEASERIDSGHSLTHKAYDVAEESLAKKEQQMIDLSRLRIIYDSLNRQLQAKKSLLFALQERLATESAQMELKRPNAAILDNAKTSSPTLKKAKMILYLAGAGGIALGICPIFLITVLDNRVKSAESIKHAVGMPTLGILPYVKSVKGSKTFKKKPTSKKRYTADANLSFGLLRESLTLNALSSDSKLLMITSTLPGDGKSFVSLNLAKSFAKRHERVLMIDCDLRRSSLQKRLGHENWKGLSNYIATGENLDESIHSHSKCLDILPTGTFHNIDCDGLFSSSRFIVLIKRLRQNYDRIILDTAPILSVSDSMQLLPLCDGVIYVVRYNSANANLISEGVSHLRYSETPLIGMVINAMPDSAMRLYHYRDYRYKKYPYYSTESATSVA
ncbi:MAG: GumC family protein [Opitutaceae bacterium]